MEVFAGSLLTRGHPIAGIKPLGRLTLVRKPALPFDRACFVCYILKQGVLMGQKHGFTLMEILVVLIIIAMCAIFAFPNMMNPSEQARALTAQNNLLAVYAAQKNYFNNNGTYCLASNSCADIIADINANLSLNIQDDSSYSYACGADATGFSCNACRNGSSSCISGGAVQTGYLLLLNILNKPVQLNTNNPNMNPTCVSPNTNNQLWCPNGVT